MCNKHVPRLIWDVKFPEYTINIPVCKYNIYKIKINYSCSTAFLIIKDFFVFLDKLIKAFGELNF